MQIRANDKDTLRQLAGRYSEIAYDKSATDADLAAAARYSTG